MLRRKLLSALILLSVCRVAAPQVSVVDFEGYSEGVLDFTFTDPTTGVFFSDARRQGETVRFVIEYGGPPPGQPGWFGGNSLVGGGWAPGPSPSRPANFAFAARFPSPVPSVVMDVNANAITTTGSVSLEGLDSSGGVVASSTHPVTGGLGQIFPLSVSSPTSNIASIRLVPNNVFNAVDNIAFIPEPASLGLLASGALCTLWRRRDGRARN